MELARRLASDEVVMLSNARKYGLVSADPHEAVASRNRTAWVQARADALAKPR